MYIDNKYKLGDTVYLKTDEDQKPRIVVQITLAGNGSLFYMVACGEVQTTAYEMEMSTEKNFAQ
jgi:hypothetical protein